MYFLLYIILVLFLFIEYIDKVYRLNCGTPWILHKTFETLLTLSQNMAIITIWIKFETNLKIYMEVIYWILYISQRSAKYLNSQLFTILFTIYIPYHIYSEIIFRINCMFKTTVPAAYCFLTKYIFAFSDWFRILLF